MAVFAIPFVLKAVGAVCLATGLVNAKSGYDKRCKSEKMVKKACKRDERNLAEFNAVKDVAVSAMDELGKLEMEIISSFEVFSKIMEIIQATPKFKSIFGNRIVLPELTLETIKDAAKGAKVLWAGIGGAAAGTFAAFAASGAITATTAALGTTATGVSISTLHGVAATKATLALLGGGAVAKGGGGIYLGGLLLNFTTIGLGILIGGCIYNSTADKYVEQADAVYSAMLDNERKLSKLCSYLNVLNYHAVRYTKVLNQLYAKYKELLPEAVSIVEEGGEQINFTSLSSSDQKVIEGLAILTDLLYSCCKVSFVLPTEDEEEPNTVNVQGINEAVEKAKKVFSDYFRENLDVD